MTRYLLDTNVISEVVRPQPSRAVMGWLGAQADEDLFVSAVKIGELRQGIQQLAESARRRALSDWFEGPAGPLQLFAGRILVYGVKEAMIWAELRAVGQRGGQPRDAIDTMIAAIALANDCVVATLNTRHFPGVPVLDPSAS